MLNTVENTSVVLQTFFYHQYKIGTVIYIRKALIQTVRAHYA